MKTTKKILLGLSSLGLASAPTTAGASTLTQNDSQPGVSAPLSAHSRANVRSVTKALKTASGGKVNADNVVDAIKSVKQSHPSVSLSVMASSLSQLGLDKEGTKNAVFAMASAYSTSESKAAEALITETLINEGKSSADIVINDLKETLGDQVVNPALEHKGEMPSEDSMSEDLQYNFSPYNG